MDPVGIREELLERESEASDEMKGLLSHDQPVDRKRVRWTRLTTRWPKGVSEIHVGGSYWDTFGGTDIVLFCTGTLQENSQSLYLDNG